MKRKRTPARPLQRPVIRVGDTVAWKPAPRVPTLMGRVTIVLKNTVTVAIAGDDDDLIVLDRRKVSVVGSSALQRDGKNPHHRGTENTEAGR